MLQQCFSGYLSCSCRTDRSRSTFPTQCYNDWFWQTLRFTFGPRYFVVPDSSYLHVKQMMCSSVPRSAGLRPGQCCQCCHQAFLLLAIFFPRLPHGALRLFGQCSVCWRFAQTLLTILRPHIWMAWPFLAARQLICFVLRNPMLLYQHIFHLIGLTGRREAYCYDSFFFVPCLACIALGVMLTRWSLTLVPFLAWMPRMLFFGCPHADHGDACELLFLQNTAHHCDIRQIASSFS